MPKGKRKKLTMYERGQREVLDTLERWCSPFKSLSCRRRRDGGIVIKPVPAPAPIKKEGARP